MNMATSGSGQQLALPQGWSIGAPRETSQTNPAGQVVQGVLFPLTGPSGGTTSVFVPYSMLGTISQVQDVFDQRIAGLTAITG